MPIRRFRLRIPVQVSAYSPLLSSNSCKTVPIRRFHRRIPVQVSDCSPPLTNSCKSKSVTVCRLRRTPARQCLFAASVVEFLQDSAYSPLPPSNSCPSQCLFTASVVEFPAESQSLFAASNVKLLQVPANAPQRRDLRCTRFPKRIDCQLHQH